MTRPYTSCFRLWWPCQGQWSYLKIAVLSAALNHGIFWNKATMWLRSFPLTVLAPSAFSPGCTRKVTFALTHSSPPWGAWARLGHCQHWIHLFCFAAQAATMSLEFGTLAIQGQGKMSLPLLMQVPTLCLIQVDRCPCHSANGYLVRSNSRTILPVPSVGGLWGTKCIRERQSFTLSLNVQVTIIDSQTLSHSRKLTSGSFWLHLRVSYTDFGKSSIATPTGDHCLLPCFSSSAFKLVTFHHSCTLIAPRELWWKHDCFRLSV